MDTAEMDREQAGQVLPLRRREARGDR
jgi:hypothetical protein